jgi:Skp family chaperone for outer membrane proteins
LLVAAGVVALVVLAYGRPLSQAAPKPERPAPRTRIALLNLTYVIKNYEKFKTFQQEILNDFKSFQEKDEVKKKLLEESSKESQDPKTTEARRKELAKQIKDLEREIQDNNVAAKKAMKQKGDEQMKVLYLDIVDAATRHARSHDFEMVLHYNEATTKEDFYSTENVARKLQAGTLLPLYAAPGLDISQEVAEALNRDLKPAP